jgi:hypothetical protein
MKTRVLMVLMMIIDGDIAGSGREGEGEDTPPQ